MEEDILQAPLIGQEVLDRMKNKYPDVAYGKDSERQRLDLYLPEEAENPLPLVMFIHGGAFRYCDKRDVQVLPYFEVLRHGYALASINYRLSGEALFPAGIRDCKAALRFLGDHAGEYGIDPERVAVAGGSAGANYALMLAASEGAEEFEEDLPEPCGAAAKIKCAVSWYAPTNFLQMDAMLVESGLGHNDHSRPDSPESLYLGGQITELDPDYVQRANPMTYITEGLPPVLLQHGRNDCTVPYQQSKIFYEKAKEITGDERVVFEILEEAEHADPLFETRENMDRVIRFLDTYLK